MSIMDHSGSLQSAWRPARTEAAEHVAAVPAAGALAVRAGARLRRRLRPPRQNPPELLQVPADDGGVDTMARDLRIPPQEAQRGVPGHHVVGAAPDVVVRA